jgi:hypothetical protein
VLIDGIKSNFKVIKLGVPQGSVLGPILFLIYFNSLLCQHFKGKLTAFADDVAISYKSNTYFELICNINHDLDLIRRWFFSHKLLLGTKTKIMYFSLDNKIDKIVLSEILYHHPACKKLNFKYFNSFKDCHNECFEVEVVHVFYYLGVAMDWRMKWSAQACNLETYSLAVIRQFYYLKKYCSTYLLKNIYFALLHSKLQYGIACWGGTYEEYFSPIFTKQKCVIRLILNKDRYHSSLDLFKELKILPLKHLFFFNTLKVFFRMSGYWQVRFSENYSLRMNNLNRVKIPPYKVKKIFFNSTSTL